MRQLKKFNHKYIAREISFIAAFAKSKRIISGTENWFNKNKGIVKKERRGFTFMVDAFPPDMKVGTGVTFSLNNSSYTFNVTDAWIKNIGAETTFIINAFTSLKSERPVFSRMMIAVTEKHFYLNIFREGIYSCDLNYSQRGLLKVALSTGESFDLFTAGASNNFYLVVDSVQKMSPETFKEKSWSILVALGYLTGYLPQDEAWFFYYNNKKLNGFSAYSFRTLRNTIKSIYKPVFTNPHGWIKSRSEAERFAGKIEYVTVEQFSNLCQLVDREVNIKAILLLIIESITSSLLVMPAGLSVALEGLTEYFQKMIITEKPLTDKTIDKKLRKDLALVLETYKSHMDDKAFKMFHTVIMNINRPGNAEKLKAPFRFLGIKLSSKDLEVLGYRNAFLHGNINLMARKKSKPYSMDLFEISLRLYTLLNKIIMKQIGYNSLLVNHARVQSQDTPGKIIEDYYIPI